MVALALRRFIDDDTNDLKLAVLGPFAGTLIFAYAAAVTIWVQNGFRSLNYVDLFVLMPLWALVATAAYFLVTIPTGYVAQQLMRWAANSR